MLPMVRMVNSIQLAAPNKHNGVTRSLLGLLLRFILFLLLLSVQPVGIGSRWRYCVFRYGVPSVQVSSLEQSSYLLIISEQVDCF